MSRTPLFQAALGERWALLAPEVRALHDVTGESRFAGVADVTRGSSLVARIAGYLGGLPRAGQGVPVRLAMHPVAGGEQWERQFGGRPMRSMCLPSSVAGRTRERLGPVTIELELEVVRGDLHLTVRRGWILWVPMPRFLLPVSTSREYAASGRYHFDVAANAPLRGGLIVRYRGWLAPE